MKPDFFFDMVTSSPKPLRTAGSIQNVHVQRKYRESFCTLVWTDPLQKSSLGLLWHCWHSHISSAILHFSSPFVTKHTLVFCSTVHRRASERAPLILHSTGRWNVLLLHAAQSITVFRANYKWTLVLSFPLYTVCKLLSPQSAQLTPQRYRSHFKVLCRCNISAHGIVCNYKTELSTAEMKWFRGKVSVLFFL